MPEFGCDELAEGCALRGVLSTGVWRSGVDVVVRNSVVGDLSKIGGGDPVSTWRFLAMRDRGRRSIAFIRTIAP